MVNSEIMKKEFAPRVYRFEFNGKEYPLAFTVRQRGNLASITKANDFSELAEFIFRRMAEGAYYLSLNEEGKSDDEKNKELDEKMNEIQDLVIKNYTRLYLKIMVVIGDMSQEAYDKLIKKYDSVLEKIDNIDDSDFLSVIKQKEVV